MTTLVVHDRPMCCATGICGPEVDPRLTQFASDLEWLEARGVRVERINPAQEPERFAENESVGKMLEDSGEDRLPAIVVGDAIVASGRYPDREELAALTGLSTPSASAVIDEQTRELIALGAAIGASCEPCFKFHYDKARKLDVSVEAMREAVRIGDAVKAASARNIVGLADRFLGVDEPQGSTSSCGDDSGSKQKKTSGCC